ncbi:uncharacterized protein J8A68_004966 [[Candida] subhashii]|uniref:Get5 N-terminal domain-containing protein n=1 Tax=[Candida] subhashii TaxID=561895 RepID=A0A8J5QI33_9ASCO|nr:uncharacterized protein J8A68_004966 [[Candida] subhashii]KAG7661507.1 hypothetical protein J8A68_004966 [[Candida] subhashii]
MSETATIVPVNDERQFAHNFLQLMALAADAHPDQFNSSRDYSSLNSLGPSLPAYRYKFPIKRSQSNERTVTLKFKSIRPPFKFSSELTNVSCALSVYKVKTALIESLPELKSAGVAPENIKLMVKSKVVHDTTVLETLEGDEISFNCMVSPPAVLPTPTKETEQKPEQAVHSGISTIGWGKIFTVLVEELGSEEKAKEMLLKLQKC